MHKLIRTVTTVIACSFILSLSAYAQEQESVENTITATENDTQESIPETTSSGTTGLTITTDGVTTTTGGNNLGSAYVCTLNDLQRRVEIDLLNAPAPVPCEVNYYKDSESSGAKATLWSAQNDSYYCESQAKALIEKLQAMNWSCSSN